MPANTNPLFVLTPNSVPVFNASANTASDGTGGLTFLLSAGTNGTRIDQVVFRNAQTTQAASSSMLGKVWVSDTSGANFQLVGEVAIASATRSATVIGATGTVLFSPALVLKSGQIMSISQSVYAGVQDRMSIIAYAADF